MTRIKEERLNLLKQAFNMLHYNYNWVAEIEETSSYRDTHKTYGVNWASRRTSHMLRSTKLTKS